MNGTLISSIHERYESVLGQIAEATARSGRANGSVRLVVVTKSRAMELIQAAITAGATILGENYAEEAVPKIKALPKSTVEWHMIGHVQSRKSDLVVGNFSMLHTLDSVKLARRLDRSCQDAHRKLPVLLEVNISGEQSKFGFPAWDDGSWSDLKVDIEQIMALSQIQIRGLMTMPPYFEDAEQTRPYFKRLHQLQLFLSQQFPQVDWVELSMGTSTDFIAAIEEGATFVRVGQAILGPREV
jgi:pyridoxal phosphate enzyme (YggS family)